MISYIFEFNINSQGKTGRERKEIIHMSNMNIIGGEFANFIFSFCRKI